MRPRPFLVPPPFTLTVAAAALLLLAGRTGSTQPSAEDVFGGAPIRPTTRAAHSDDLRGVPRRKCRKKAEAGPTHHQGSLRSADEDEGAEGSGECEPEHDDVVMRAVLASEAGRMTEAARLFQRAAELDPDEPAAWANLGVVWMRRGNRAATTADWSFMYSRARRAFRRSLELLPNGEEAIDGTESLVANLEVKAQQSLLPGFSQRSTPHSPAKAAADPGMDAAVFDSWLESWADHDGVRPAYSYHCRQGCGGYGDRLRGLLTIALLAAAEGRSFAADLGARLGAAVAVRSAGDVLSVGDADGAQPVWRMVDAHVGRRAAVDRLFRYATGASWVGKGSVGFETNVEASAAIRANAVLRTRLPISGVPVLGPLMRMLLQPSARLKAKIDRWLKIFRKKRTIAMHLRTAREQWNEHPERWPAPRIEQMTACVDKMLGNPPLGQVFIASDHPEAVRAVTERFKDTVQVLYVEGVAEHLDRAADISEPHIDKIVLDHWLLGEADELVLSAPSQFGKTAAIRTGRCPLVSVATSACVPTRFVRAHADSIRAP